MTITNSQLTYTKAEALQRAHDLHMKGELDEMRSGAGMFDPSVATAVTLYGNTEKGREKLWNDKVKGPLQQGLNNSGKDVFTAEELAQMINEQNKKFGGNPILTAEKVASVAPDKAEEMTQLTEPQTTKTNPTPQPDEDSAIPGGPLKQKGKGISGYLGDLGERVTAAYGGEKPNFIQFLLYAIIQMVADFCTAHEKQKGRERQYEASRHVQVEKQQEQQSQLGQQVALNVAEQQVLEAQRDPPPAPPRDKQIVSLDFPNGIIDNTEDKKKFFEAMAKANVVDSAMGQLPSQSTPINRSQSVQVGHDSMSRSLS